MTYLFTYDGTGKLSEAIADLCGCSARNHNKIAELIQQAKDGLGITTNAKKLPDNVKLAIYRWHVDRLYGVKIPSQPDDSEIVNIISQPTCDEAVNIVSQPDSTSL